MLPARRWSLLLGILIASITIHPICSFDERWRHLFRTIGRKLRSAIEIPLRRLRLGKSGTVGGKFTSVFNGRGEQTPTVVEKFLTPSEARELLDRYEPLLRDSLHVSDVRAVRSRYRTSTSVRLPPLGDPLVLDLERRAASLAGFDHGRCEDFQLACYGVDELYGLHRDDAAEGERSTADRAATVLVYLREPGPEDAREGGNGTGADICSGGHDGDGGSYGGETLFTRRPLEEERDLDTGRPLHSEEGALRLFRSYCDRPRRGHVVISPRVGRAVTWRTWLGDDLRRFASASTHGACPVKSGRKCVVQQWITKSETPLPLRDGWVAAIFPSGADLSYRRHLDVSDEDREERRQSADGLCFPDVSAHEGRYVPELCVAGNDLGVSNVVQLEDGPYPGVGALSVFATRNGGLSASPTVQMDSPEDGDRDTSCVFDDGLTVSFWARHLRPDTVLLSIGDTLRLQLRNESGDGVGKSRPMLELTGGVGSASSETVRDGSKMEFHPEETDWVWFTLSVGGASPLEANLIVRSHGGREIGRSRLEFFNSTLSNDLRMMYPLHEPAQPPGNNEDSEAMPSFVTAKSSKGEDSRAAFVPPLPSVDDENAGDSDLLLCGDVSFIVIHRTPLDNEEVTAGLRLQAKRYDVKT